MKLALTIEADSQVSARMPHESLVDDVSVPDSIRSSEELMFELVSSQFGPTNHDNHGTTSQIKAAVLRDSGH